MTTVNVSSLTGRTLQVSYTGAYAGSVSISAADNITNEAGTSTFTLANNSGNPTAARLNGTALTGLTDLGSGVWQYNNPLLADDAAATLEVDVESTTISTTISYANSYPYELVTHGTPDANSIFFDAQFATLQPVEWGIVTDYDAAVVIVDHAAMDVAEDELNDVALHSTDVAAGTSTATYKYFVQESGATGTFQATITVGEVAQVPQSLPVIGTITKDTNSASIPFTYGLADATGFEHSTDGVSWLPVTSPVLRSGLTDNTTYSGQVRAVNATGAGAAAGYNFTTDVVQVTQDNWPFHKAVKCFATENWTWGKRHPKTGMRVRVYK